MGEQWFRKVIAKIRYRLARERCYSYMEDAGVAVMGCCRGVVGGNGLDEQCIDCPHLVSVQDWEKKGGRSDADNRCG